MTNSLTEFFDKNNYFKDLGLSVDQVRQLVETIEEGFLADFLENIILNSEEILSIDPNLARREILELAAAKIVKDLNAEAASIRLLDSRTLKMLSFGSFGLEDLKRASTIPVSKSIAGLVVNEGRSIVVPSIKKDPLYRSKKIIASVTFS